MPSAKLVSAIREFTTTLLNPYDLPELLHRVTGHAMAVADAQGAGIMLAGRGGNRLGFAAASDDEVLDVEIAQDRIEAGPCYDAFLANRLRTIDDLVGLNRWPEYEQRALERGFRSVMGVPMNAAGQTIGVVNIYRTAPGPWSADDIEGAEIITAMGAGYVLHANQIRAQHEMAEQLQFALESRDVIGQAKGILMARFHLDADAAFEKLRSASQGTNLKLRDVAAKLVESERVAQE